jgi:hypothetical protein
MRQTKTQIKQMTATHDPDYDFHKVEFSLGGYDGVTIAVLSGDTIRVSETHDGGTVGYVFNEVPLQDFLKGLGIETFTLTKDLEKEWWQ